MLVPSIFGTGVFDDLDNFFDFDYPAPRKQMPRFAPMKTDIREVGDKYEILMDLPGFKKEDLQIELKDGYLTVGAEKHVDNQEHAEAGRYVRRERYSGSFRRSFYVGKDIEETDISARFEDGVLKLGLPREKEKKEPEKRYINID